MLTLGLILFSISEHSFILTAASKLYLVRTTSDELFKQVDDYKSKVFLKSGILSNTEQTEVRKHKFLKINLKQSLRLFVSKFCKIESEEVKKLSKLYHEAEHKIYHDLNVVRLIKTLKDMKILLDSHIMDNKIKF
jgi:hypothetical protein